MPWDVLCTYAEVLHIKLPIQPNDLSSRPSPWRFLSWITKPFYPNEKLISKETEFFTAPFEKSRQEYFYVKEKDLFFTPSMRSRMASCLQTNKIFSSWLVDIMLDHRYLIGFMKIKSSVHLECALSVLHSHSDSMITWSMWRDIKHLCLLTGILHPESRSLWNKRKYKEVWHHQTSGWGGVQSCISSPWCE